MFGLIARWTVSDQHREQVLAALARMTAEVEKHERGCLLYQSNVLAENQNVILLYERYVDAEAFAVHGETEHFKSIVLGEIVPLLDHRERINLIPVH